MEKRLQNLPAFDRQALEKRIGGWKGLSSGPGSNRTVIEWSVGTGPRCFLYPAADRKAGINLLDAMGVNTTDERYADWLEFDYVPQVVATVQAQGQNPQVICTDQRPIQVMRARRRTLASNGLAKVAMGGAPNKH